MRERLSGRLDRQPTVQQHLFLCLSKDSVKEYSTLAKVLNIPCQCISYEEILDCPRQRAHPYHPCGPAKNQNSKQLAHSCNLNHATAQKLKSLIWRKADSADRRNYKLETPEINSGRSINVRQQAQRSRENKTTTSVHKKEIKRCGQG